MTFLLIFFFFFFNFLILIFIKSDIVQLIFLIYLLKVSVK